ncbi:MAG: DUF2845 domain-containing protein [Gammaproteobacteria bacterium]|nr:MAG: DUF2845 domain-containing protein [Gammaproteobacteria bacterium]
MKHVSILLAAISVLGLLALKPVYAGTLVCGNYMIQGSSRNPTTKYEILKKCGEPKFREGDTWVYERSGTSMLVHFKSGQVTSIRRGN